MILYSLRNKQGKPVYIGRTNSPEHRRQSHKGKGLTFVPLMRGLSDKEASELEIALIQRLAENGYHLHNRMSLK